MKKLIEALQILLKYGDPTYPTHCRDEELNIMGIKPEDISAEDRKLLHELGFIIILEGEFDEYNEETVEDSRIYSYRYGSI